MTAGRRSTTGGRTTGLYIHIPLCASRCRYCAFAATTDLPLRDRIVHALAKDIRRLGARAGRSLATLYLGGGTPSLLTARELASIVGEVSRFFAFDKGAERTLEANPDDVVREKLELWQRLGFTRLSLGVQSFDEGVLRRLGRRHDAAAARRAVASALDHGFRVSLDLMLGVPGGQAGHAERSAAEAIALAPHHVSVYLLELDKPTAMAWEAASHPDEFPDDEDAARAYLAVGRALVGAGYRHYEISNFGRPGHFARHNLGTWQGRTLLAVGPAAAGHAGRRRFGNVEDVARYLACIERGESPRGWSRRLSGEELLAERVMLQLRLASGVREDVLDRIPSTAFHERLAEFLALGLARRRGGRVRLTPRGWLVSSELLACVV